MHINFCSSTENHFATLPVAIYGAVLWLCGMSYYILARVLIHHHGENSKLARAIGADRKGVVSLIIYTVAVPAAFVHPWISCALYVTVAVVWFLPDRRIENVLTE